MAATTYTHLTPPTGLTITNPLVLYRSLIASRRITPDRGQLRLALQLQKLYERLKDYQPAIEYSAQLRQISRTLTSHDHASPRWQPALFAQKARRDSLALTRQLTSRESALSLDSPRGLMLHGDVGTGKSMLLDLFADSLPHARKRRWHFSTFMLHVIARLEARRLHPSTARAGAIEHADDYSLLWLARDLIHTSPILFLDEFQLPDRASSRLLTNLMTSFFHLGGVLIASSNRMPEELAKAAGVEYAPPPGRLESLRCRLGLRRRTSDGIFGGENEFAAFLDVLKARCEVWEMEGSRDYRRLESGSVTPVQAEEDVGLAENVAEATTPVPPPEEDVGLAENVAEATTPVPPPEEDVGLAENVAEATTPAPTPRHYVVTSPSYTSADENDEIMDKVTKTPWKASSMKVYARTIVIPRTHNGSTCWTFDELCKTPLGPADYISLASTYHTLILTDVPVLSWLMKNEARRFITLLDALYECRCKLTITAAIGPDAIFALDEPSSTDSADAIYPETLSEVYQDATAPFRPNILSQNPLYAEPDYTHARLAGLLSPDALEDGPPNRPPNPFGRRFGRSDAELERAPIDPDSTNRPGPDFTQTTAFTGADERFAYRRAQSRVWEMCGAKWHARGGAAWHRPLPVEVRRWERPGVGAAPPATRVETRAAATLDRTSDERMFGHGASPFRSTAEPPPAFSWTHIWGTAKWPGTRAGAWGQGVDGLKARGREGK